MIWFGEEVGDLIFGYFRVAIFDESGVELPAYSLFIRLKELLAMVGALLFHRLKLE